MSSRPADLSLLAHVGMAIFGGLAWFRLRDGDHCAAVPWTGPRLDKRGCGNNPHTWMEPGALAGSLAFGLCLAGVVALATLGHRRGARAASTSTNHVSASALALLASAALGAEAAYAGGRHLLTVNNGVCLPYGTNLGRAPCDIAGDLRPVWAYGLTATIALAGVVACVVFLRHLRVAAAPEGAVRGRSSDPTRHG